MRMGKSKAGAWLAVCHPRQRYENLSRYTCNELLDQVNPTKEAVLPDPSGTVQVLKIGKTDVPIADGCRWFQILPGWVVASCEKSHLKIWYVALNALSKTDADGLRAMLELDGEDTHPCTVFGHATRCVRQVSEYEFMGAQGAFVSLAGEAEGALVFAGTATTREAPPDAFRKYGAWIALD